MDSFFSSSSSSSSSSTSSSSPSSSHASGAPILARIPSFIEETYRKFRLQKDKQKKPGGALTRYEDTVTRQIPDLMHRLEKAGGDSKSPFRLATQEEALALYASRFEGGSPAPPSADGRPRLWGLMSTAELTEQDEEGDGESDNARKKSSKKPKGTASFAGLFLKEFAPFIIFVSEIPYDVRIFIEITPIKGAEIKSNSDLQSNKTGYSQRVEIQTQAMLQDMTLLNCRKGFLVRRDDQPIVHTEGSPFDTKSRPLGPRSISDRMLGDFPATLSNKRCNMFYVHVHNQMDELRWILNEFSVVLSGGCDYYDSVQEGKNPCGPGAKNPLLLVELLTKQKKADPSYRSKIGNLSKIDPATSWWYSCLLDVEGCGPVKADAIMNVFPTVTHYYVALSECETTEARKNLICERVGTSMGNNLSFVLYYNTYGKFHDYPDIPFGILKQQHKEQKKPRKPPKEKKQKAPPKEKVVKVKKEKAPAKKAKAKVTAAKKKRKMDDVEDDEEASAPPPPTKVAKKTRPKLKLTVSVPQKDEIPCEEEDEAEADLGL